MGARNKEVKIMDEIMDEFFVDQLDYPVKKPEHEHKYGGWGLPVPRMDANPEHYFDKSAPMFIEKFVQRRKCEVCGHCQQRVVASDAMPEVEAATDEEPEGCEHDWKVTFEWCNNKMSPPHLQDWRQELTCQKCGETKKIKKE